MTPYLSRLSLVVWLVACSEASLNDMAAPQTDAEIADPTGSGTSELRLDVFPGTPVDAQGQPRALPQTLAPLVDSGSGFDLGAIALLEPGTLSGFIAADVTTPWAAGLPTTRGAVSAEVRVVQPGSVQRYTVSTDQDGVYQALLIPASDRPYQVSVVPTDPNVPFASRSLVFRSADEQADFDLGPGVAIYGRVLTGVDQLPLADARVSVRDADGVESSQTRTDSGGWYTLYVQPDREYTVVCAGRDHGRDPVLTSGPMLAEAEAGGRADFEYPSLTGAITTGRVVDTHGFAVAAAVVRFTATSLDRYDDLPATLVVEEATDANGSFEASLLDGQYDVEILPPVVDDVALDHGPAHFSVAGTGLSLGDQVLPDLVPVSGSVVTSEGDRVPDARVTCREIGFGGRSWSTFANGDGAYELYLPPTPLQCTVQPPGQLAGRLAWTSSTLDPVEVTLVDLVARAGRRVFGNVTAGGQGEAFALVEVRDADGELLGSALTAGESADDTVPGAFELRIDR